MEASPKKENEGAKDAKEQPQPKEGIPAPPPAPINVTVSGELQLKGQNEKPNGHDHFFQNPEWWLVILTLALVYVTARLVFFTKKLWGSTNDLVERSEGSIKALEKAYIYGGPGGVSKIDTNTGNLLRGITIGNYGKTLGFLWKVDWDECPFSEWNAGKKPMNCVVMRDVLYPHTEPRQRIVVPLKIGAATHVIWGRVHFKDVFGDSWYSTWEHRLEPHENWGPSYPLEHNAEIRPDDETDTHTAG